MCRRCGRLSLATQEERGKQSQAYSDGSWIDWLFCDDLDSLNAQLLLVLFGRMKHLRGREA